MTKSMPLPATALVLALAASLALPGLARAADAASQKAAYSAQAGAPPDAARGQRLFTTQPAGREWSCASCHNALPTQAGRHASTGKTIAPLAPAFNPQRFTDVAKTEKWFRRNCKDVFNRECSAAEKADVIAWLMTL